MFDVVQCRYVTAKLPVARSLSKEEVVEEQNQAGLWAELMRRWTSLPSPRHVAATVNTAFHVSSAE